MEYKELEEWEAQEREKTESAFNRILNKPEMPWEDRVKVVYPELSLEKPYAYRQDLGIPIRLLLPFYKQLVFHIDSFKTKEVFMRYHDALKPEELARLYCRGRIRFLLASSPTEYAGLDYLDPILQLKPPTVIRMRALIASAAGSWAKLDERQKEGERIFSGKVETKKVPGLYESLRRPKESVEGHTISSYINLCCMGFEDLVKEVIKLNDPNNAAKVLIVYDSLLVRPLTTGMLGQPQITKEFASLARELKAPVSKEIIFPLEIGRVLVMWYNLDFPLKPGLEYIEDLYKERVMDSARKLLVALEEAVRERKGDEALERAEDIREVLREAQEAIKAKMEKYRKWFRVALLLAGIGSHFLASPPQVGLLTTLGLSVVSLLSNRLVELVSSLRTPPLQTAIWNFKKRWDKVRP
ncbi:MAG: hypothetical protein DRJ59_04435 [Thermoprotei archaeon]|nr:MAG: hypothetical protein DRJ59_04435 [Thermoprotei archaeon]